jgi:RNA polymerase sigma-70 factor (ECF subfamily)
VGRETIELAFLAALQVLPPRQRAALLIRDVLGWPAAETATLLDTSVAAANSALQRARSVMRQHLPPERADWQARPPSPAERELLAEFIAAHERLDATAIARIASADIRVTMPPMPYRFAGIDAMVGLLERAGREGEWRLVPTAANRMPAAASYRRQPGDTQFRPFKLDVLRIEDGVIAEITTFGSGLFGAFGLPPAPPR